MVEAIETQAKMDSTENSKALLEVAAKHADVFDKIQKQLSKIAEKEDGKQIGRIAYYIECAIGNYMFDYNPEVGRVSEILEHAEEWFIGGKEYYISLLKQDAANARNCIVNLFLSYVSYQEEIDKYANDLAYYSRAFIPNTGDDCDPYDPKDIICLDKKYQYYLNRILIETDFRPNDSTGKTKLMMNDFDLERLKEIKQIHEKRYDSLIVILRMIYNGHDKCAEFIACILGDYLWDVNWGVNNDNLADELRNYYNGDIERFVLRLQEESTKKNAKLAIINAFLIYVANETQIDSIDTESINDISLEWLNSGDLCQQSIELYEKLSELSLNSKNKLNEILIKTGFRRIVFKKSKL